MISNTAIQAHLFNVPVEGDPTGVSPPIALALKNYQH